MNFACAFAVLSVLSAAPKKAPKPPPPPPTAPMPKVQESLSDKVLEALANAEKIQVWRAASSGGLRPDPSKAIGADFVREAPGSQVEAADLATLRGLLYDDKSYRFDADVARCNFKPDVSFKVDSGLDTLEMLISFSCNQLLFYQGKPGGRWLPGGRYDVRPARAGLLALSKKLLPADAPTQKLK